MRYQPLVQQVLRKNGNNYRQTHAIEKDYTKRIQEKVQTMD